VADLVLLVQAEDLVQEAAATLQAQVKRTRAAVAVAAQAMA
jgi:hypothetical protein